MTLDEVWKKFSGEGICAINTFRSIENNDFDMRLYDFGPNLIGRGVGKTLQEALDNITLDNIKEINNI